MDMYRYFIDAAFSGKQVSGKNEFELFQNFYCSLSIDKVDRLFEMFFEKPKLKNDEISATLRKEGNLLFSQKKYEESQQLYVKSLCFATVGGREYAIALANRSAVLLANRYWTACIKDVDMCLEADYPENLKPKVLFRKLECLIRLRRTNDAKCVADQIANAVENMVSLSQKIKGAYILQLRQAQASLSLIKPAAKCNEDFSQLSNTVPKIEENPKFLCASTAVELRYNSDAGRHVCAQRNIKLGEILFVEKAFAFCSYLLDNRKRLRSFCQNCLVPNKNFIPCNKCVKFVFCSKSCRDEAWESFHKWECAGVQTGFWKVERVTNIIFRYLVKGAHLKFATKHSSYEEDTKQYGNAENNYPYVNRLLNHFDKLSYDIKVECLMSSLLLLRYLKTRTDFFNYASRQLNMKESNKKMIYKLGGIAVRFCSLVLVNSVHMENPDRCIFEEMLPNKHFTVKAIGLFPSIHMMNNSCMPNTSYYTIKDVVVVKALEDIKCGDEIYFEYLPNSTHTRVERRKLLKDHYHFLCKCPACVDPKKNFEAFDAYICFKCKGSLILDRELSVPIVQCLDCKFQAPLRNTLLNQAFIKQETLAGLLLSKFQREGSMPELRQALKLYSACCQPFHFHFISVYVAGLQFCLERGALINGWKYFVKARKIVEARYGELSVKVLSYLAPLFGCCYIMFGKKVENTTWQHVPQSIITLTSEMLDYANKLVLISDLRCPVFQQEFMDIKIGLEMFKAHLDFESRRCVLCEELCSHCFCKKTD